MSDAKKSTRRWVITMSVVAFLAIVITVGLQIFSAHADLYLGRGKAVITQAEGTESWPSTYYESDYDSLEATRAASAALIERVEAEGIVLLKNSGSLPMSATVGNPARITLLGRGAVDPVYGGSGSGSVDVSQAVNLKDAMEERGFEVNNQVFQALADFAKTTARADIVMDKPNASSYEVGEMPVADYSSTLRSSFASFNDAAVVVIARAGGEGGDLTQDMEGFDDNYFEGQHQLELNKDEQDLIDLAKENFDTVIVLVNSSSAMELGLLEDDPGVDAIVWIGSPGQNGFYAVADVLNGTVTPSGRTVDIYAADFTVDPTFDNFGNFRYRNVHGANAIGDGYFVQYEEGIYYGYRYYETAAAEGFIDYDEAVVYPFGYGLSYTNFDWEVQDYELGDVDGRISVQVKVTNSGSRYSGKDVVQLYVSAPYYEGGIEKAEVVLADFAKTRLLAPGESDVVTLSLAVEDMASYDYKNERAYVLEEGDYGIRVQNNSHEMKEGVDEIIYTVDRTVVYSGGNHRISDETEVTNQFDDVSALFVDQPADGMILNMSRADFAGTFPSEPEGDDFVASEDIIASFGAWDPAEHEDPRARMPVTGENNGISLIAMRGRDFDDPAWEPFLDQIDPADIAAIVVSSAYATKAIPEVGKPATVDLDGPAGISAFMGDIKGSAFPSAVVMASTYNVDILHEIGVAIGNEGLQYGVNGWYAPAVNIHRSPFAGRNFEYYSEDPVLSGKLATAVVSGTAEKGVYSFLKHFALNDQETNRVNNGVATWANEQAIREVYLKPFEMVVKNASATIRYISDDQGTLGEREINASTAFMSSFNRIGATWTGGSVPLMNNVLREEWGFEGAVISDFNLYDHMFVNQGLMAGTDFNITFESMKSMQDSTSATAVTYLRRTAHRLLYTVAHSNAMNGLVPGTKVHYTIAPWRVVLIIIDILVVLFLAFGVFRVLQLKKNQG